LRDKLQQFACGLTAEERAQMRLVMQFAGGQTTEGEHAVQGYAMQQVGPGARTVTDPSGLGYPHPGGGPTSLKDLWSDIGTQQSVADGVAYVVSLFL
jgi:hypothetical protein